MHQIRFPLRLNGLYSRARWVTLQCSPDPLAVFKGPVSKGKKGKGDKMGRDGRTEGGAREKFEACMFWRVIFALKIWTP